MFGIRHKNKKPQQRGAKNVSKVNENLGGKQTEARCGSASDTVVPQFEITGSADYGSGKNYGGKSSSKRMCV